MGQINLPDNWIDEKRDLQRQIDELRAAFGLASALISRGGLRITNDAFFEMLSSAGVEIVYIGPSATAGHQTFAFRRSDGSPVFTIQLDVTSGTDFWALWDRSGQIVVSDDVQSGHGLARPWLSVPLYPQFTPTLSPGYWAISSTNITTEKVLWEGRIPLVSHPKISVDGVWGQASGSNSSTYKLYVNGTVVGTWSETTVTTALRGPYDVSSFHDQQNAAIQVRATATGTGDVAAQVLSCYLRQT